MTDSATKTHEFVEWPSAAIASIAERDCCFACGQYRGAPIHHAPSGTDAAPSAQCDRCKNWVPQNTVKVQAGVTFCAHCQDGFLNWVALASEPEASGEVCKWTLDPSSDFEVWESACGESWQFENEGPKENKMRFCCYCGKRLEEVVIRHDDDE